MAKSRSRRQSSCPRGTIRRKSFNKRAYSRKSYTRKSGSRVKAARVSRSHVASTCVPDKGARGKTPASRRVLPKIGRELSLRKYGYSTHKPASKRHESLKKASSRSGSLKVLRHLNLLRNYQADDKAKNVLGKDVKYMSQLHRATSKKSRKSRTRRSRRR